MDLFDFLFPEQAQAHHLRKLVQSQRHAAIDSPAAKPGADQVEMLQADIRLLTLLVTVLLKRLDEAKLMSMADVRDLLQEVDSLDGVKDGGLDPGVLRGLLGVLRQEAPAEAKEESFEIKTDPLHRYRR